MPDYSIRRGPFIVVVAGPPVAKGRTQFVRRSGFAYTPAKTRKYEAHVRLAAQETRQGEPPLDGACSLTVLAVLPVPQSWSQRKHARAVSGSIVPTTRPDVDNFLKAALDGCNGIVYRDDSQIISADVLKRYVLAAQLVITVRDVA